MPLFDYKCTQCDERIEIFFRKGDPEPPSCQKCQAPMEKTISAHGGYSIGGPNGASQRPKNAGSFKKGRA